MSRSPRAHAEAWSSRRAALLLQALSATATIVRKAPAKLKHYRMRAPFEISMAGPPTSCTERIASNAQGSRALEGLQDQREIGHKSSRHHLLQFSHVSQFRRCQALG